MNDEVETIERNPKSWAAWKREAERLQGELNAAETALSAEKEKPLAPVILEIANERLRQISVEGWTTEHDEKHSSGELAGAAGCYAKHVNARQWCFKNNPDDYQCEPEPSGWPWAAEWWKPKNPRSDLIRAAALIVAELERLDRAAGFTVEGEPAPVKYIVILQRAWCNDSGSGINYHSDLIEFDKRDKAIKYGFELQDSDDFNIGVLTNGVLTSFDWMAKPLAETKDSLARIANRIGIEGNADAE